MTSGRTTRIVILGGGFGGIYTALELEKTLARARDVEITLVNQDNFFLFTPMLHEVAASDLDITHIVNPIRKLLKRVRFFEGRVECVDLRERRVVVSHGSVYHQHELEYDHLVLGLGSITNFFNLPGLEERALTMKTLGDAITLRNRIIGQLEEADFECAAGLREHLLTIVIAGGGFAGVETIAAVNDFVRDALKFYPHLDESVIRMVLVHPGDFILPELGEKLGRYAEKQLSARGVEIRVKTRVTGVNSTGVQLSDGSTLPANTLVWTAGTSPHPLLTALPCEKQRGRICVNEFLEVRNWPGVWSLGDCAVVPDLRTGQAFPPTAQHAIREARTLARNISAAVRGGQKKPFTFKTIGALAAIGRRTGVAQIFGVNFSGFFAWFLWRTIYLGKLPRFEKRLRVALDWTLDVLFSKDLVKFLTTHGATISSDTQRSSEPEDSRAVAAGAA